MQAPLTRSVVVTSHCAQLLIRASRSYGVGREKSGESKCRYAIIIKTCVKGFHEVLSYNHTEK